MQSELRKRKKLFVENENTLFVLQSAAGATAETFEAEVLSKLKHKGTIEAIFLYAMSSTSLASTLMACALMACAPCRPP